MIVAAAIPLMPFKQRIESGDCGGSSVNIRVPLAYIENMRKNSFLGSMEWNASMNILLKTLC